MNGDVERESGRMTKTKCLIWGTPAFEYPSHGDGHFIDSPRAGGKYLVAGTSAAVLESCDDPVKARLTSWLIEQRQLGIKWPEIYSPTISEAQQRQALQAPECADGILRYLKAKSKTFGTIIRYSAFIDLYNKSLMTPSEQEKEFLCLLAHTECINMDDLSVLMDHLEETRLIKISGDDKVKGCNLTVAGYARLAELEKTNVVSSRAFVAMWFDPSMHDVWEGGFKIAIREAGYKPIRIDQREHVNKICDEIVAEIRKARFVVADFTHGGSGVRGGVYYEAGFAHGLDIPVIFTCRADMLNEIHFDTRQFNHITWEDPEELKKKLADRIAAVIGDAPFLN